MPLLGAHMSIAGGLERAFDRIAQVKGEALQIFTRNQRQWVEPPLTREAVSRFRARWREAKGMPVAVHGSYLINLASPEPLMEKRSVEAFRAEIRRAEILGIPFLIMHPGAHMGAGIEAGLERLTGNLDTIFQSTRKDPEVMVLLEITAGQGTGLGSRLEELAYVIEHSRFPERLSLCVDTAHLFAAGYDFRTPAVYHNTLSRLDEIIGLDRVRFFHMNDSLRELGSRVDRHTHIGKGAIGLEGFSLFLNDPRFKDHPMVLETPKGPDLKDDMKNLRTLRNLTPPARRKRPEQQVRGSNI
jgi:deoxyribonuclease IV